MSRAIRMCRAICQVGIGLAVVSAIGGCSDEPASDEGAETAGAGTGGSASAGRAAGGSASAGCATDGGMGAVAGNAGGAAGGAGGTADDAGGAGNSAADGSSGAAPSSAPPSGGAGAMAAAGGGGMSGGGGSSGAFTFSQCPDATPPAEDNWDEFPACDGSVKCGEPSHCIPIDRLKMGISDALINRLPDCSTGKCMPDDIIRTGRLRFNTCTGDLGEGRCVPQCSAIWVMPFSVIFETGVFGCGSEEVCAPCQNPVTQQPSGACESDLCPAGAEL